MNCAAHQETSAVGFCTICGRGICPDCVQEVAERLTCGRAYCNETLVTTKTIMDGQANHRTGAGLMAVFYAVFSMVLIGTGVSAFILGKNIGAAIAIPAGLVFGALAIHVFSSVRKMKRKA